MSSEFNLALYQETAQSYRHIIDWRHKILSRYFLTTAALFAMGKWMWESKDPAVKGIVFLPFLISAIASFAFFLMERRNARIKVLAEQMACCLEKELRADGAFYTALSHDPAPSIYYTKILLFAYIATSLLSILLCLATL